MKSKSKACWRASLIALAASTALAGGMVAAISAPGRDDNRGPSTKTPIKHLVVIFQENITFDRSEVDSWTVAG